MRLAHRHFSTSLASIAVLATTGFSSSLFAQPSCDADTCPAGYECESVTADCPPPACEVLADGGVNCSPYECEPVEYAYCARASCESDADCGGDMVCHTFEQTVCSGVGVATPCPAGEACDTVDEDAYESECEQTEFSQCAYPHELPCESDSECGDGYECVASESCWCTGSAGEPSTDPAVPGSDEGGREEPECGCEPTGTNHCQRLVIDCESDADCPASWSCLETGGSCWADSEGNSGCDEGPSRCYPAAEPGGGVPGGVGTDPGGEAGFPDDGDPTTTPGSSEPSAPPEPNPPTTGPDAPQDNAPGDGSGGHHGGHPGSGHHFGLWAGCSIDHVGGSSSGTPWALSVLALGAALLRRRQR